MKLDYIPKINSDGDNVVRLYDFNRVEAEKLYDLLQILIESETDLSLESIDFIESRNCSLTLQISDEDLGIVPANKKKFLCQLTIEGYKRMLILLEPFCKKETKGYQYLYDLDNPTDFLLSPAGTW